MAGGPRWSDGGYAGHGHDRTHTVWQPDGRPKSFNPKNKGKKSYPPILTFLAETREYISGEPHNGDRPTGPEIARHFKSVFAALPPEVKTIFAGADSEFYCWDAATTYEGRGAEFIIASKTARLVENSKRQSGSPHHALMPTANASFLSTGSLEESLSVHRPAL